MDLEDLRDDSLERIHAHADENEAGFTSHAPMVVDALLALGHADRIEPFLDAYLPGFPARTDPGTRAASEPWADLLDSGCDWRVPLDRALAEMAPTLFAAATHGLIRVAHAVRGIERRDGVLRRRELALAFDYWRTSEARLPGVPGSAAGAHVEAASLLADLEVVPNERRGSGLFTESAESLRDHPPFAEAVGRLRIPDVVEGEHVSALTRAMLAPYFESPLLRIAYVHTITAPSALRLVAPQVEPGTLRALYGYGFQAVAALHAISKLPTEPTVGPEAERLARDADALAGRAAYTLEEHVIKLTEACLREHNATGDSRFLLAAADAVVAEETRRDSTGSPRESSRVSPAARPRA